MVDIPEQAISDVLPIAENGVLSGVPAEQMSTPDRPETYLEKLERHGVQVRADDFAQPVVNNQGQQLVTPIPSNVPTVTIPTNQQQLLEWAKGPDTSALTWLSRFWIRSIKRAIHFGWRLIIPQPIAPPVQNIQSVQHVQQLPQTPPVQNVQQIQEPVQQSQIPPVQSGT